MSGLNFGVLLFGLLMKRLTFQNWRHTASAARSNVELNRLDSLYGARSKSCEDGLKQLVCMTGIIVCKLSLLLTSQEV